MCRYNINDIVKIVKENDRNYGREAQLIDITDLVHFPVTIYRVKFEDGKEKDYFFSDIWHR